MGAESIKRYTIEGQLEVDPARGVIWFHHDGGTKLRICGIPTPLPDLREYDGHVDVIYPAKYGIMKVSNANNQDNRNRKSVG